MLDFAQVRFERLLRGFLHRRIQRRVNVEAAEIDLLRREDVVQVALDRIHRVVFLDLRKALRI